MAKNRTYTGGRKATGTPTIGKEGTKRLIRLIGAMNRRGRQVMNTNEKTYRLDMTAA